MKKLRVWSVLILCSMHTLLPFAPPTASIPNKFGHFLSDIVIDAARLHINLFSVDSAKIVTAITPFYIGTRFIDERVQSNFYDPGSHKNIYQMHNCAHWLAKNGVAFPMIFLSSAFVWGWTQDIRYTGWMTAIGLPFVQSGKDIIKKARTKACLRPWNEHFSKHKRSSGGFPSGHMANIAFLTTLWGIRHGPKWAVPIALFGVFLCADFVNCNRHYVSQMVAGAGLGILYGFAACKVVDTKVCEDWQMSVEQNKQGDPCLQIGYKF